ncbi:MAG: PilW family protein [Planctomycetota bacterium]|jgi:Tfp pilus assembly protein PilW
MKQKLKKSGFTLVELVELMVALVVASIVLAAVATLAHAATVADRITDQTGREQSQLRMVSMRLSDLIRRANGVVLAAEDGFKLWHDANADWQQKMNWCGLFAVLTGTH